MNRGALLAWLLMATVPSAPAVAQLRTRVYATGFTQPVAFIQDPVDRNVQFVVQQGGRIRVVPSFLEIFVHTIGCMPPARSWSGVHERA